MMRLWTAIPNFVDCEVFKPIAGGRQVIRSNLGVPENAFVVGCVAAVKKHHKRIDYLIREFASYFNDTVAPGREEFEQKTQSAQRKENCISAGGGKDNSSFAIFAPSVQISFPESYLLIAGAKTDETAELIALAESLIPGHYRIMTDISRAQMPDLYRAMDVFVLTSLFEMMPIALLEALASGLPCVVNRHPVLEWMTGVDQLLSCPVAELLGDGPNGQPLTTEQLNNPTTLPSLVGGKAIDMSQDGALAATLAGVIPVWISLHGPQARERAVTMFSAEAVIGQYVEYYKWVNAKL